MTGRCEWAGNSELIVAYHDHEWGVPCHDDGRFFEMITLEGAQAGLSWDTILKKREGYRGAFDGFDPAKIVLYSEDKVRELLQNPGIVRNQAKIRSTVGNAGAYLKVQEEFGSFDAYIWRFVDGNPKQNAWRTLREIPAKTPESDRMSKDLAARGFKFVGSTICYAFMQATGMVNDHVVDCPRHAQLGG